MNKPDSEDVFNFEIADYDEMLNRGIRLSGENKWFFIEGRLRDLCSQIPSSFHAGHILDFGCGMGETVHAFARLFPAAQVTGADPSEKALRHAREHFGSPRISFFSLNELFEQEKRFDLVYVNGVFHHILPKQRAEAVKKIGSLMNRNGYFVLFENNPWSMAARLVMRRIPFDRDAVMLSTAEARQLLSNEAFECFPPRFLFYFPKFLHFFRILEAFLIRVPFGAQYYILGKYRGGDK